MVRRLESAPCCAEMKEDLSIPNIQSVFGQGVLEIMLELV